MSRMELGDIYNIYRLKNIKWGYSDFAKDLTNDEFVGYAVIDVDAGGVGYHYIDLNNQTNYSANRNAENIALRPTMIYSYYEEFVENKKEISDGIFEVTFGEYPNSKIIEKINSEQLVKTGRKFTIKENGELVSLDEYVDQNGIKMVNRNCSYYRVEEVKWLVDKACNIMITSNAINGGFMYEPKLTSYEESHARHIDHIMPTKIGQRRFMIIEKSRNDDTLVENYMSNIMYDELVGKAVLKKISQRDAEKAKKEQEEQARLKEIRKEKNRLYRERTRAQRERRCLMNYLFPNNAWSAMSSVPFGEDSLEQMNQLIREELPNVKHYVDDKETLIEIIIYLYKGKDGLERLMPYPECRYDACRAFLENFDLDYLNVVLKETIGNDKMTENHVEYLINNNILSLRRK